MKGQRASRRRSPARDPPLIVSTSYELPVSETGLTPVLSASRICDAPPGLSLPRSAAHPGVGDFALHRGAGNKSMRLGKPKGRAPKTPKLEEEQDAAQARAAAASSESRASNGSASSESSSEDDDDSLQRMVAMRTRSHSKPQLTPDSRGGRSPRASTPRAAAASGSGSSRLPVPQTPDEGWDLPSQGRRKAASRSSSQRRSGERRTEDGAALVPDGSPAAGGGGIGGSSGGGGGPSLGGGTHGEDEGDWGMMYSGSKDASHRVKGKHGRNAKQAVSRQYAIDARQAQREASHR